VIIIYIVPFGIQLSEFVQYVFVFDRIFCGTKDQTYICSLSHAEFRKFPSTFGPKSFIFISASSLNAEK